MRQGLLFVVVAGLLRSQPVFAQLAQPSGSPVFRLDAEAGVAGLAFGQLPGRIPDFGQRFRPQGKPRMQTQLYRRLRDTTLVAGIGRPDSYWFRQGKFIGVDVIPLAQLRDEDILQLLTLRYGSPKFDRPSASCYWLGRDSFIYLSPPLVGRGRLSLMMGSLALLHELVTEAPVRAEARRRLSWQPDSIGLAPQWPKRR